MRYQKAEYDIAQPMAKTIKVPLDSDYGVAVKVLKNGEGLELDAITVDGHQATGERNGWQLYELSSGSTPCIKHLEVEAVGQAASTHYGMTKTGSYTNPIPFPASSRLLSASLSEAGVEDTIQLNGSDVKMLSGWMAGQAQGIADLRLFPVDNTQSYVLSGVTWINRQTPSKTADSLEVTPDSYIELWGTAPGMQPVEVRLVFEADVAGEASTWKLPLAAIEEDLGRIEVSEQDE